MPRDVAGDYTLPLPDVVDGTTIDSTWANPTMDDVGDAITDSLDRNGRGGMNVPLENQDGVINAPGIAWANEPASGFFRAALNEMHGVINGVDVVRYIDDTAAPAGSQKPIEIWDGAAWKSPLFGKADEDPTFGELTVTSGSVVIENDLDVTGTYSQDTTFTVGLTPGSFGWAAVNFALQKATFNVTSVTKPGVGHYRVKFARDLLGSPDCIVLTSGHHDGFGIMYPVWSSFASDTIDIQVSDTNRIWTVMAVLVDA